MESTPATPNSNEISLKVFFGDDIRRFHFSGSVEQLRAKVKEVYAPAIAPNDHVRLKYMDDENDLVTLTSLENARSFAPAGLVKVYVSVEPGQDNIVTFPPSMMETGDNMHSCDAAEAMEPSNEEDNEDNYVDPSDMMNTMDDSWRFHHGPMRGGRGGHGGRLRMMMMMKHRGCHPGHGHGWMRHHHGHHHLRGYHAHPHHHDGGFGHHWHRRFYAPWMSSPHAPDPCHPPMMPPPPQSCFTTKDSGIACGRRWRCAARLIKDVTVPKNANIAPGVQFTKTWRFRNDSAIPWPEGSALAFISWKGDQMGAPDSVPAPSCQPGSVADISVPMVAPNEPGKYCGHWRLTDPHGFKFGQRVKVQIRVPGNSSSSSSSDEDDKERYADLLEQLDNMGFKGRHYNCKLLKKKRGDMNKVVKKLTKRGGTRHHATTHTESH